MNRKICRIYLFFFFFLSVQGKNILLVVPQFPKVSDVHMLNQMIALVEGGHSISIFAKKRGAKGPIQEDVLKYSLLDNIFYETFPSDINNFDIVIFQLGHLAFDIKKELGFKGKAIVCIRGYDITGYIKKNPYFYSGLFESIDLFLPVCKYFKKKLINLGCPKEKIIVLYSAIDTEKFTFTKKTLHKNKITYISACRFVEKKGIHIFLKSLSLLVKKYPKIKYILIGDGPYRNKYLRLIRKYNLKKYVKIIPWSTHKILKKLLDRSDFCIVPSLTAKNGDQEGIPNIAKEAMAIGLPVISTYHAGIPELIKDEESGFLVEENNYKKLADKLMQLLRYNYNNHISTITKNARNVIEKKFSKKVLDKKICTIISNLF